MSFARRKVEQRLCPPHELRVRRPFRNGRPTVRAAVVCAEPLRPGLVADLRVAALRHDPVARDVPALVEEAPFAVAVAGVDADGRQDAVADRHASVVEEGVIQAL